MPAIFNAQLSEYGSYYRVSNVFLKEVRYILPNAKYVDLPNQVALILKNNLNEGKLITIKKENVDNRESPDIPLEHFDIREPESIEQKKSQLKSKVTQRLSAYTALLSGLDLYDFFVTTIKLTSRGFNVLDEANKEDEYLKIINTNDEDIISDLERFLELKNTFDRILKKYRGTKDYFREVDACETEDELEEVNASWNSWLV